MKEFTHFIAGKPVKGNSGRFGDIFNPATGEVQGKVPFASRAEMHMAVEAAVKAFPEWSAVNPQRRARVMFNFKSLVEKNMDELARMLSSEHGKVIADSKGDIQRGLEVIEFACGIPHLSKGEYTEGAGPGIDIYSMRQPLGVVAGITPFNFPAMIPMWMFGVAIACGNTFICKPSEKDPSVPLRLAELLLEAGAPAGVLNVVNGDKEAVDAILEDPDIQAVSFVGSSAIAQYVYSHGTAHGKRVQAMGGAKNHAIIMPDADLDQVVNELIGAGYGSAGERCMAISVAVPVTEKIGDALVAKLKPRVESLRVSLPTDPDADYGPLVTDAHRKKVLDYIDLGVKEGADRYADLSGRNIRSSAADRAREGFRRGDLAAVETPIRQRRGNLHARRRRGARIREQGESGNGRHKCADPRSARLSHIRRLEAFGLRRRQSAWAGRRALLHASQDGNGALAQGRSARKCELCYSDDEMSL
jgi:malonate-semialdehyde dehydrogenase (acetylating)/methylmalonate-semialdehyde dehydrogenase